VLVDSVERTDAELGGAGAELLEQKWSDVDIDLDSLGYQHPCECDNHKKSWTYQEILDELRAGEGMLASSMISNIRGIAMVYGVDPLDVANGTFEPPEQA